MARVEYAVDVWDLSGTDERPNSFLLLEHLRAFGEEGWELVSLTLNIDLAEQGPSHLLVFKRQIRSAIAGSECVHHGV